MARKRVMPPAASASYTTSAAARPLLGRVVSKLSTMTSIGAAERLTGKRSAAHNSARTARRRRTREVRPGGYIGATIERWYDGPSRRRSEVIERDWSEAAP